MVGVMLIDYATLLAQRSPTPDHIPETPRTIGLMALLAIALLGLLMIVGTLLGGHWVRRLGEHRRGPAVPPDVLSSRSSAKQPPLLRPQEPPKGCDLGDTLGTDETTTS